MSLPTSGNAYNHTWKTAVSVQDLRVFGEATVSGDAQDFRVYILNGELICRNRVHFILHREKDVFKAPCCCLDMKLWRIFWANFSLTRRNDAVEVCKRTSVLWLSWNTATWFLLSTATLRHRLLHGLGNTTTRTWNVHILFKLPSLGYW